MHHPLEVTPTQPPCEDKGPAKFCKKMNKKKCKKSKIYKQCKKACNKCDEILATAWKNVWKACNLC